jgi:hypothetical protein
MDESVMSRNQEVISYLIGRLRTRVGGRKKLMKLMFLMEHCDSDLEKLTEEQFLGNDFIIYKYGVFSSDVMEDYLDLCRMDIIDDYPIRLLKNTPFNLSVEVTSRMNCIIDQFGDRDGAYLENYTLELMKLNKQTKMKYFGKSVIPLIKALNTNSEPVFTPY